MGRKSATSFFEFSGLSTVWSNHFWARGYFVSTVGLDEAIIRRYVKYHEHHDSK